MAPLPRLAALALLAAAASADDGSSGQPAADQCAAPSAGACLETGYPLPGVNVDDDCCATAATASCAEGYAYARGAVCKKWDTGQAVETCCTLCSGPECDRGPGATCARPEAKVCMERGYPRIAHDNVDEDCCAPLAKGWCANGWAYTMGETCYDDGTNVAYATCCQPCNSTTYCDDGPGNDKPPPNLKALAIIGIVFLVLCVGSICGGLIICYMCCAPRGRPSAAGAAPPAATRSGGSYVPVEMGQVVAINEPDDSGVELNDFGSVKNPVLGV